MRVGLAEDAEERLRAVVDLVGRSGARQLQIGYLHENVPSHEAAWYAHAQYRGARVTEENHRGAVEAMEALAMRLLIGGKCVHCGGLVAMVVQGSVFFPGAQMADGSTFTEAEVRAKPPCRWTRVGPRWKRGCE